MTRGRRERSPTPRSDAPVDHTPEESSFRVLMVCTGNICRSPSAAVLLAQRLRAASEIRVESAGTAALVGHPVEAMAAELLSREGVSFDGFRARRLAPPLVRRADLVLGMAREHRTASVQMAPDALKRSFTLRELARLAAQVDPEELVSVAGTAASVSERLTALVQVAPRYRGPVTAEDDDVADPYRRGRAAFAAAHAQIVESVGSLVHVLRAG